MKTYADATRCPDCGAPLPQSPEVCRACALPLTGPTAWELFSTLQSADRLIGQLRAQKVAVAVPVPAPREPGSLLVDSALYPAPRPLDLDAPRLRGASVPKILLTLGALCLLVAAVTFLAVAWSWLGVGGRTVVLVALTVTALGLAVTLHRRGLRMAGEALSVVGLGLLSLDVVGLRHAGWIGQMTDAHLVLLTGATVTAGALALLLVTASRPMVSPALVAPVAAFAAGIGAQVHVDSPAPMLVTVAVLLGLGRVGTTVPSTPLRVTSLVVGALAWLGSVGAGLGLATEHQTVVHLWGQAGIWPLVAAAALAASAGPVVGLRRTATLLGYGAASLLGSYVVVLAALDNSATAAAASLLPVAALWVVAVAAGPERLRTAAVVPLAGTVVLPLVTVLDLVAESTRGVLDTGDPFTTGAHVHVAATTPWFAAWLLVPSLVVVAAAACAVVALLRPLRRTTWTLALCASAVVGGVATLPLYDVPLAVVVGLLAVGGGLGLAAAERRSGTEAHVLRSIGAALVAAAVLSALPNDLLTALALVVAVAGAALLMSRTDLTGEIAAGTFPPAFGGLVWAAGHVMSVPAHDLAVPVLLALGALAILRPQPVLEASAAVVGLVMSVAAIADAHDTSWALAVHLTVAGALVTATSLVHPLRRALAWPGGLLLAAATWVRLAQLGVHAPEAYTLPAALVLCTVGVWRLRRDDTSATLTLLAPGLTLATVPSLLAALGDPVSPRAVLLGAGCLAIVLAGVRLRWSAPVVVGAVVGTLLVLRELAPYAATIPPWLLIGLSGTLLTVVGVTWESRMRDVRSASRYVGRLR